MDKQQEQPIDFRLHGFVNMQKSMESGEDFKSGDSEKRLIWGEISNQNLDEQNEILIAKSLDFSYFDDQGFVKYEHNSEDPGALIGVPHARETTPEGGVLIKAALLEGLEYADKTWALIESLEKHNIQYPDNQRTLAWSIEGGYTDGKKGHGGMRKAKVVNVVVTPNPQNKTTYLKKVGDNHAKFAKSLMGETMITDAEKALSAGEGTGPDMTKLDQLRGGRAITTENIDDEIKETAEEIGGTEDVKPKKKKPPISKSKRSPIMFETMEKAIEHFTGLGESEENAKKLAKSFFPDGNEEAGSEAATDGGDSETAEEVRTLSKSFADLKEKLVKAISPGTEETSLNSLTSLESAASDNDETEMVDVAPMLFAMEKSLHDTHELLRQSVNYGFERDQQLSESLDRVETLEKSLASMVASVQSSVMIGEGDKAVPLSKGIEAVLKSRSGQVVDLESLTLAGEVADNSSADTSVKKMSWGELQTTLEKGIRAAAITDEEANRAETAHRSGQHDVVQSVVDLIPSDS